MPHKQSMGPIRALRENFSSTAPVYPADGMYVLCTYFHFPKTRSLGCKLYSENCVSNGAARELGHDVSMICGASTSPSAPDPRRAVCCGCSKNTPRMAVSRQFSLDGGVYSMSDKIIVRSGILTNRLAVHTLARCQPCRWDPQSVCHLQRFCRLHDGEAKVLSHPASESTHILNAEPVDTRHSVCSTTTRTETELPSRALPTRIHTTTIHKPFDDKITGSRPRCRKKHGAQSPQVRYQVCPSLFSLRFWGA